MNALRDTTAGLAALLPALIVGLGLMAGPPGVAVAAEQWPAAAYVLQVDGLACPYCGYGIEKQFHRHEGVERTDIDVENGVVVVSVSPATRFSDDELEQIVHDAGFELGSIVQRPGTAE